MEIKEKVLKYKYHITISLITSTMLVSLVVIAPSFLTILAYFWPLFLSTALFLVAVIFFAKTSPPVSEESGSCGDKPGESLLDYVAGQSLHLETQTSLNHDN